MSQRWQVLRQQDYRAVPWKNGGGVTHEVLRVPAEGPSFDWRVSVAQIDRPGPFSNFAGYTRYMALLAGQGVRLKFAEGIRDLRRPGDLVEFDGAQAVECEPFEGSCTDLNLMVAQTWSARVRVLTLTDVVTLAAPAAAEALLFAIGCPLAVTQGGESLRLERWDALRWQGGAVRIASAETAGTTPSPLFFATIRDGRQSPAAPVGR